MYRYIGLWFAGKNETLKFDSYHKLFCWALKSVIHYHWIRDFGLYRFTLLELTLICLYQIVTSQVRITVWRTSNCIIVELSLSNNYCILICIDLTVWVKLYNIFIYIYFKSVYEIYKLRSGVIWIINVLLLLRNCEYLITKSTIE